MPAWRERGTVLTGLLLTLAVVHLVPYRLPLLGILPVAWWAVFRPVESTEYVMFGVASLFFLGQNYVTLAAGLFEFRFKDILLMPWYEPVLWGFYFLAMKRWAGSASDRVLALDFKSVAAVVLTSSMFSLFSSDSDVLFAATAASTVVLFWMFHTRQDLAYALFALSLGFIIELFGVSTGLWWYPEPDFLGIPYWFATMWLSVGLLGRRFLLPVSALLARLILSERSARAR